MMHGMELNNIEVLTRIYKLSNLIYPDLTLKHLYRRSLVLLLGLKNIREIQKWYEINDNTNLRLAIERYPLMHGAIYWPYINKYWQIERKLSVIDAHYRLLNDKPAFLSQAVFQDVNLAVLEEYFSGLYLQLDKPSWFIREGEVVLNLFHQDTRLYSIAFTLGIENGEHVVYVGALQGSNTDTALDIYRQLTKSLHGMRPRDFMITMLKILCNAMYIKKLWAISDEARQHNSDYFNGSHREKVVVNYDEVWMEQGGVKLDNGFYEILSEIKFREEHEIPSRKRATYRRRYMMLSDLEQKIRSVCAS